MRRVAFLLLVIGLLTVARFASDLLPFVVWHLAAAWLELQ